tara:strand:+ start:51 stop:371 length:321 start_codon:yes stop_codon:yes gene_type:complete
MPAIPVIPFDGRTNVGVPQYNGLFQDAQKRRPDFAGQIFENIGPVEGSREGQSEYPTALDALGGLGGGALDRFNEVHPVGGMPAPGGTGLGSKIYDFLYNRGFGRN